MKNIVKKLEHNPIISYEIDENKIVDIQNIENYLNEKILYIKNAYDYQKNISDNSIEENIPILNYILIPLKLI